MFIVTHTNPDFDAIGGVWLLKRFGGLAEAEVKFVNTGNPDKDLLARAKAVVDTGREYDVSALHFDHHHLLGQEANETCAAMQVYKYLQAVYPDTFSYLAPLIGLILVGDTGRNEAKPSRELGIHALLSGFKASFRERQEVAPDQAIMEYGMALLDTLALHLRNQAIIKAQLAEKIVYQSRDGLVWAIKYGSAGSSFAAFDEGARIVVFEGEPIEVEGGMTYPVGIMRAGEWQEPHIGNLVERIRLVTGGCGSGTPELAIWEELGRWFLHPAGFFGGRGTAKAPVFEPVNIDLQQLASFLDTEWAR